MSPSCVLLQEHFDPAAKTNLVLKLELAQVVLTQRDVEAMRTEGIAEIWKVHVPCPCAITG